MFPEHKCYVELFCGAAVLFFIKQPSGVEILNDINGDIVNLYRIVQHHQKELHRQFQRILTSRDQWDSFQQTPLKTLTDIQRAARFLYCQKLAFGGE